MKEYQLQKAIVTYIKLQYPNVLYCASAGGLRTSMTQAVKMKASGYIKGYPDLSILEPVGKFHSLFLEVKTKKAEQQKNSYGGEKNLMKEILYLKLYMAMMKQ